MRLAAHQPVFFPSLHLLAKAAQADVLVLLEQVQFERSSWHHRNRLRSPNAPGWDFISVPTRRTGHGALFATVPINNEQHWHEKQRKTFRERYGRAPHYAQYASFLDEIYTRRFERLIDLNTVVLHRLFGEVGAPPRTVRDTEFSVGGTGTLRLIKLCKALRATTYVASESESAYQDLTLFAAAGITYVTCVFRSPEYPQIYPGFVPDLSAIDALLSIGPQATRALRAADFNENARQPFETRDSRSRPGKPDER